MNSVKASDYEIKPLPKPEEISLIESEEDDNEDSESDEDIFFSNPNKINWNRANVKKRVTKKKESGSPKKKLTTESSKGKGSSDIGIKQSSTDASPKVEEICIDSDSDSEAEIGPLDLSKVNGISNETVLRIRQHGQNVRKSRMETQKRLEQLRKDRKLKREEVINRSQAKEKKKVIQFDADSSDDEDDDIVTSGAPKQSTTTATNSAPAIKVKFRRSVNGKMQVDEMKVQNSEKFSEIVQRYVTQFAIGMDPASLFCEIDGDRIKRTETPDDHDLDEGDLLEVKELKK